MKIIVAETKLDCQNLLGKFLDESYYDNLIEEDCDAYMPLSPGQEETYGEDRIIFKFRKNWFSEKEQTDAYNGLREAAIPSENRGLASGVKEGIQVTEEGRQWVTNYQQDILSALISHKSKLPGFDEDVIIKIRNEYPTPQDRKLAGNKGKQTVWVLSRFPSEGFNFEDWVDSILPLSSEERAQGAEEVMKFVSVTSYAASVFSGIAGWFDRYPRIPYGRETNYTRDNFDKFKNSYPFLQTLSRGFKELFPIRYNSQILAANKIDSKFLVPETPFTTITVNKNFRTAAHFDAGDLNSGLSNLLTLSNDGNYTGGYLIAPEYRLAINVRPGDLLLINNHEVMHANTPIICTGDSERISLVVYFREKMLELGTKEYEDCRYEFIESRRLDKEHPYQRILWNGISPGWENSEEWSNFLLSKGKIGTHWLKMYHPNLYERNRQPDLFG